MFLRVVAPLVYVVAVVGVAGAAAAAITSEHEEDTWVSLTATDLTGREILFAKLRGALERGRRLAEVILILAVIARSRAQSTSCPFRLLIVSLTVYS